jgi:hypothetical protein
MKKTSTNLNKTQKEYRTLSKTQVKKHKAVDDDLSPSEIETLERIESGKGRFSKTYANPHELIEDLHKEAKKRK